MTNRLQPRTMSTDHADSLLLRPAEREKVSGELGAAFVELKSAEAVIGEQVATESMLLSQGDHDEHP